MTNTNVSTRLFNKLIVCYNFLYPSENLPNWRDVITASASVDEAYLKFQVYVNRSVASRIKSIFFSIVFINILNLLISALLLKQYPYLQVCLISCSILASTSLVFLFWTSYTLNLLDIMNAYSLDLIREHQSRKTSKITLN